MDGTRAPSRRPPPARGGGVLCFCLRSCCLCASSAAVILLLEQLLNGVQFGVMLFLMAAGLTLIFGIMNLINLAHGSLYMIGAYVAAATFAATHSFLLALGAAIAAAASLGVAIEVIVFRALYRRDHLDQVLATFGLILFFNEMVRIIWGATALYMQVPPAARRPGHAAARRAVSRLPARDHRVPGCWWRCCCGCWSAARGPAC